MSSTPNASLPVKNEKRSTSDEIELLIKARYPLIYVVTWEERRILDLLDRLCSRMGRKLYRWSYSKGVLDASGHSVVEKSENLSTALDFVEKSKEKALFVFLDLHDFMSKSTDFSVLIVRKLRDITAVLTTSKSSMLIISPVLKIPFELEKDIALVEFDLPGYEDMDAILGEIENALKSNPSIETDLSGDDRERLLKASLGLTKTEAENAFAKVIAEDGRLDADDIENVLREKEQLIKKTGVLEFIPVSEELKSVGGMEILKEWLCDRSEGFSERARQFQLPAPRGVLLLGVPGCGKSLCAKAVAAEWQIPMLKLDMGSIFGMYVGQSEENIRKATKIAESIAPCVLWIDEIEKGFSGVQGGGDGGTASRVFGSFLTWMQEKTKPVFVFATANNIKALPPEFLRKGRFDEIFFVDLPFEDERKTIFSIHLKNRGRDPANFNLDLLAQRSDGYSGAEIEEATISALYRVFKTGEELRDEHVLSALEETQPLSETMKEQIQQMRSWAKLRARYASQLGRSESGEIVNRWANMQAEID